jgi:hypothetical protein
MRKQIERFSKDYTSLILSLAVRKKGLPQFEIPYTTIIDD